VSGARGAPASEAELGERARAIAGRTLGALACELGWPVPAHVGRAKGWVGELVEAALGASAASRPGPDFAHLGVELKTVPVDRTGRPRESTYVCSVPLHESSGIDWACSPVRRKLERVLWVPVEAEPSLPLGERRVGSALLWSPSADEDAALKSDWDELMDMVCFGRLHRITAHHGQYLQIRPKAADSRARRQATGEDGAREPTLPRGFYLRASFTRAILRRHYALPR